VTATPSDRCDHHDRVGDGNALSKQVAPGTIVVSRGSLAV